MECDIGALLARIFMPDLYLHSAFLEPIRRRNFFVNQMRCVRKWSHHFSNELFTRAPWDLLQPRELIWAWFTNYFGDSHTPNRFKLLSIICLLNGKSFRINASALFSAKHFAIAKYLRDVEGEVELQQMFRGVLALDLSPPVSDLGFPFAWKPLNNILC